MFHLHSNPCKFCGQVITNPRRNKIFCSTNCKNHYHKKLRYHTNTNKTVIRIDKILRRNRSIIYEFLGEEKNSLKLPIIEMERKNFHFKYFTHQYFLKNGHTLYYAFDMGWKIISNEQVNLLKRNNNISQYIYPNS